MTTSAHCLSIYLYNDVICKTRHASVTQQCVTIQLCVLYILYIYIYMSECVFVCVCVCMYVHKKYYNSYTGTSNRNAQVKIIQKISKLEECLINYVHIAGYNANGFCWTNQGPRSVHVKRNIIKSLLGTSVVKQ